jgi:hypothetical protein
MNTPLQLLLIDDKPQEDAFLPGDVKVIKLDPGEEGFLSKDLSESAKGCDLILIDQDLQLNAGLSFTASDGASLVGHFRSWARKERQTLPPLVLVTNYDEAFAREVPSIGPPLPINGSFVGREHRLAPRLDVEWMLYKPSETTPQRILDLARANREAIVATGTDGLSLAEIMQFLAYPSTTAWSDRVSAALRSARPPVSEETPGTQIEKSPARESTVPSGPALLIRWLLHEALPFPGLFLSDLYAAWTLGVTPESFAALATKESDTDWTRELQRARYNGPLAAFATRRWWTPGLNELSWRVRQAAEETGDLQKAFDQLAGEGELHPSPIRDAVVVWSDDLVEEDVAPIDEAVQIHLPGWPAEAFEPWMKRTEVAKDEVMASFVDAADLPLLPGNLL